MCNDNNYDVLLKCPQENLPFPARPFQKPILFINNGNVTGNENNYCYDKLNKTHINCLKEKYTAIVILDGEEYKQRTSHPPNSTKFGTQFDLVMAHFLESFVTDTQLPVVSISYLDQLKHKQLESAEGIDGSIVINSIEKILDKVDLFDLPCDKEQCHRFKALVLGKSFIFV